MPLYEFRCNECGEIFEMMLRYSESSRIPACPKCFSSRTQKKISAVASFGSSDSARFTATPSSSCSPRSGFG